MSEQASRYQNLETSDQFRRWETTMSANLTENGLLATMSPDPVNGNVRVSIVDDKLYDKLNTPLSYQGILAVLEIPQKPGPDYATNVVYFDQYDLATEDQRAFVTAFSYTHTQAITRTLGDPSLPLDDLYDVFDDYLVRARRGETLDDIAAHALSDFLTRAKEQPKYRDWIEWVDKNYLGPLKLGHTVEALDEINIVKAEVFYKPLEDKTLNKNMLRIVGEQNGNHFRFYIVAPLKNATEHFWPTRETETAKCFIYCTIKLLFDRDANYNPQTHFLVLSEAIEEQIEREKTAGY